MQSNVYINVVFFFSICLTTTDSMKCMWKCFFWKKKKRGIEGLAFLVVCCVVNRLYSKADQFLQSTRQFLNKESWYSLVNSDLILRKGSFRVWLPTLYLFPFFLFTQKSQNINKQLSSQNSHKKLKAPFRFMSHQNTFFNQNTKKHPLKRVIKCHFSFYMCLF